MRTFLKAGSLEKNLKNKSGYVFIHCIGKDGIKLNKNKNVKKMIMGDSHRKCCSNH